MGDPRECLHCGRVYLVRPHAGASWVACEDCREYAGNLEGALETVADREGKFDPPRAWSPASDED